MYESGPEKRVPLHVLRSFYYKLQLPSLLFSNSCERPFCMVGAVFQTAPPLSDGQAACQARCSRLWGGPLESGVLRDGLGASRGGRGHWQVDPNIPG